MNIRDLQYLVAVYDLNSFSKAAEQCFVSQPTLSGQLKKMEVALGTVLMERSTRKVLFTPLGKAIVEEARNILHGVEHIKQLAQKSDDPMAGDFHIGLIPTIGPFLLPKIIPELKKKYPQMNLFLYELKTEVLIDKLLKGELDAAILAKLDWDQPIKEFQLYQENFMLAVSSNDKLAKIKIKVNRSVLNGRSVLMLEDGHCLRGQALGVCFAAGADEDKQFQATSMDTLLHMVATGAGITLIPEMASNKNIQGVKYIPFSKPAPNREVVLVSRNNSAREQAIKNVASLIKSIV